MATHEHTIDHLDQRYYDPTIPPKEAAAGRPALQLLPCAGVADPYALLCRAFRALTIVLIAVGVVAVVLWLVFQPSTLKAYVDSAELTRFHLDTAGSGNGSDAQLHYNLTVAMSIRNPNRKQAVVYRRLEAVALYGGQWFGYMRFPRMRQERKSTMEIRPSFDGQRPVAGTTAAAFGREEKEGFFNINVKLQTKARLKVAIVDSVEYKPDVDCYIRVPDPSNSTAVAQGFTATECHVDDFS